MTDSAQSVTEAAARVRSFISIALQKDGELPHGVRTSFDFLIERAEHAARWLAWSGGQYPDDSPGDVIAAYQDGTIVLDDGITTWNPVRACSYFARRAERAASLEAERDLLLESEKEWQRRGDRAIAAEARAASLRDALEPFTKYDFHATQWIAGLEHDGHELRAIHAEDVEKLIGHVRVARAALAAGSDTPPVGHHHEPGWTHPQVCWRCGETIRAAGSEGET